NISAQLLRRSARAACSTCEQVVKPPPARCSTALVISLRIVRDGSASVPEQIKSPADVAALLQERYAVADRRSWSLFCSIARIRCWRLTQSRLGAWIAP